MTRTTRQPIEDIDLSAHPEERHHPDGRRRLKLTGGERKDIRRKRHIDQLISMLLDLETSRTRAQMAEELGISEAKIKDLTKDPYFAKRYEDRRLDIENDPAASLAKAAIVEALPKAARTLLLLLDSPSDTVKLKTALEIVKLGGVKPPETGKTDRSDLARFLKDANVNIENVNVLNAGMIPVPKEYQEAMDRHIIDVESRDVPTSEQEDDE